MIEFINIYQDGKLVDRIPEDDAVAKERKLLDDIALETRQLRDLDNIHDEGCLESIRRLTLSLAELLEHQRTGGSR